MKKIFCLLLSAVTLLCCAAAAAEQSMPDYGTGTPWALIDAAGFVTEDTPASAKDNFALYANKDRILSMEIPEGSFSTGTMEEVAQALPEQLVTMFNVDEEPASHDAKLAYDLFWLMKDWEGRNRLGVAPLKELTDPVEAIASLDQLNAYFMGTAPELRLAQPWRIRYGADPDDASAMVMKILPASLFMQDSAEYSQETAMGSLLKGAYSFMVKKVLVKLGYTEEEADRKIGNAFAFETMLAQGICTNDVQKSARYQALSNNRMTREEVKAAQGGVPILETHEKTDGYPESASIIVTEPDFLKKLSEVWTEENLPLIKDCIIVKGCTALAGQLDRECYDTVLECNNMLTGAAGSQPEDILFANAVNEKLKWPTGRLYSDTFLKAEDKVRISALVEEIREAYHGILNGAEWLSEETRANAIEKLDAIYPRVLYPDDWTPYSCEELNFASAKEGGTLVEAYRKIEEYHRLKQIKELDEPIDRTKWELPPNTVNCFYNPEDNSIYIMGSLAQGRIYYSEMSDEELYAKLGCVIGHEISHAFDANGAQYDKDGSLKNWWTEEDQKAFQAKNEKMIAYYNAMHPWEGQDFHGVIMTGEACADMAGMKVILQIAAGKSGFDYDKFFRSHADIWAEQITPQVIYLFLNDVHPLNYLRINATLQQFDEFLNCYDIREGDNMYLAPEDRVNIW